MQKRAVADHPIEPIIVERWSPRAFGLRPVEADTLEILFEAARWAPSSSNIQPWRFIYAHRGTNAHARMLGVLNDSNALWAKNAGILAMAVARKDKPDGSPNGHARYDLGQAVAFLVLQATAMGLATHQMGGFDSVKAREVLDVPEDHEPVTAIAIGYPGQVQDLPAGLREREMSARERLTIDRFTFENRWVSHIPA